MFSRRLALRCAVAVGVGIWVFRGEFSPAQDSPISPKTIRKAAAGSRIEAALRQPVHFNFAREPVSEALEQLATRHKIQIHTDPKAADLQKCKVARSSKGVPLGSALRALLRPHRLVYVIEDDHLLVMREEDARTRISTAVYPVGDLLAKRDGEGSKAGDPRPLVKLIATLIAPESWKGPDAKAAISATGTGGSAAIRVSQTAPAHRQIRDLLERLRHASTVRPPRRADLLPHEQKIEQALDSPIERALVRATDFGGIGYMPLYDVPNYLKRYHNIEAELDRTLDKPKGDPGVSAAISAEGVTLRSALELAFRPLGLTYCVDDGVLRITTVKKAEADPVIRVYPLGPLLRSPGPARAVKPGSPQLVEFLKTSAELLRKTGRGDAVGTFSLGESEFLVVVGSPPTQRGLACLLAQLGSAEVSARGEVLAPEYPAAAAARRKIEKALDEPIQLEFIETPLQDVVDYIAEYFEIPVLIDKHSLGEVGVGPDAPVTKDLKGITLRSALRLTLRELDLTFTIANEVLLITTPEAVEDRELFRAYPLEGLLAGGEKDKPKKIDSAALVKTITNVIDDREGPGSMSTVTVGRREFLFVGETEPVHESIADLLGQFRRIEREKAGQNFAMEGNLTALVNRRNIANALVSPTDLECIETPLADVVDYLKDYHDFEIQIDKKALDDVGVGSDTPITKNLKGISLRSALRLILREMDLTYLIQDEVLLITTSEEAEERPATRIHPVEDLLGKGKNPSEADCEAFRRLLFDGIPDRPVGDNTMGGVVPSPPGLTPSMIVCAPNAWHEHIGSLLARLRAVARSKPGDPDRLPYASEKRFLDALARPTNLHAVDTPLCDVLDYLKDVHGIEIQVDKKALDDVGVGTDTPINARLRGVPLRQVLQRILAKSDLTYTIENQVLLITTPEEEEVHFYPEVYPIDPEAEKRAIGPDLAKELRQQGWDKLHPWPLGDRRALVISISYRQHQRLAKELGCRPIRPRSKPKKPEPPKIPWVELGDYEREIGEAGIVVGDPNLRLYAPRRMKRQAEEAARFLGWVHLWLVQTVGYRPAAPVRVFHFPENSRHRLGGADPRRAAILLSHVQLEALAAELEAGPVRVPEHVRAMVRLFVEPTGVRFGTRAIERRVGVKVMESARDRYCYRRPPPPVVSPEPDDPFGGGGADPFGGGGGADPFGGDPFGAAPGGAAPAPAGGDPFAPSRPAAAPAAGVAPAGGADPFGGTAAPAAPPPAPKKPPQPPRKPLRKFKEDVAQQNEVYRRYRMGDNVLPRDLPPEKADLVYAQLLWTSERHKGLPSSPSTTYSGTTSATPGFHGGPSPSSRPTRSRIGEDFWAKFFLVASTQQDRLATTAESGEKPDDIRNRRHRITVECIHYLLQQEGHDFKKMLRKAGISHTTDFESLHPERPEWNRTLQ